MIGPETSPSGVSWPRASSSPWSRPRDGIASGNRRVERCCGARRVLDRWNRRRRRSPGTSTMRRLRPRMSRKTLPARRRRSAKTNEAATGSARGGRLLQQPFEGVARVGRRFPVERGRRGSRCRATADRPRRQPLLLQPEFPAPMPAQYSSRRIASVLVRALAVWLLSAGFAAAAQMPDWVTVRPQSRLVMLALDAGVGDANGGLNFNGLHEGSHRLVIPRGWNVVVRMRNSDARVPHSALITRVYHQEEMPDRLGHQDTAFPGAATPVPFTGTAAGGYAEFTFTANQNGHYFVACGVHTHLQAGMWLRLRHRRRHPRACLARASLSRRRAVALSGRNTNALDLDLGAVCCIAPNFSVHAAGATSLWRPCAKRN